MVASSSSTPRTVTVWVLFQFEVEKLRLAGDTLAASVSPELTDTLTVAVGPVASLTVKVPKSATSSPTGRVVGSTTRFAVSSSVTVTDTDAVLPA